MGLSVTASLSVTLSVTAPVPLPVAPTDVPPRLSTVVPPGVAFPPVTVTKILLMTVLLTLALTLTAPVTAATASICRAFCFYMRQPHHAFLSCK